MRNRLIYYICCNTDNCTHDIKNGRQFLFDLDFKEGLIKWRFKFYNCYAHSKIRQCIKISFDSNSFIERLKILPPATISKSLKTYLKSRFCQGEHKYKKCSYFCKLEVGVVLLTFQFLIALPPWYSSIYSK